MIQTVQPYSVRFLHFYYITPQISLLEFRVPLTSHSSPLTPSPLTQTRLPIVTISHRNGRIYDGDALNLGWARFDGHCEGEI